MVDLHYWNDGADGFIWEPLYRKRIALTPCEQRIAMHPAFRRLQGIAHYGASARILPMTHTRFTHTLGVFTLVAHFRPTDWQLRLGALLHDIGHLPFSHSAERAMGLNHHDLTIRLLAETNLGATLSEHGFHPEAVLATIEGAPANPLRCGEGGLSLDHLDSFLRDTETCGIGEVPAHRLLERLSLDGPYLAAGDLTTAREVVRRVAADHRLFLKPRCLALDTLVTMIFEEAGLEPAALLAATDEQALELAATRAPDLVDRLRNRPWSVAIRPDDGGLGRAVSVTKLYAGQVRVEGRPVAEVLPEAKAVYASLESLKRTYRVTLT